MDTDGDGAAEVSATLAFDATASEVKNALQAVSGGLEVTRTSQGFTGGYAWSVTFSTGDGDLPLASIDGSGLSGTEPFAAAHEARAGTQDEVQAVTLSSEVAGTSGALQGTFFLSFKGAETADLPFDASAKEVESALGALETVGAGGVNVTRTGDGTAAGGPGGFVWSVTFVAPLIGGDQPLLGAGGVGRLAAASATSTLSLAGGSGSPSLNVTEVRRGNLSPLGGLITLHLADGSEATAPADASAEQVAKILSERVTSTSWGANASAAPIAPSLLYGAVNVTRSALGSGGANAYAWTVTFAERPGAVPQVKLDASSLESSGDPGAASETLAAGSAPCCVEGKVSVVFHTPLAGGGGGGAGSNRFGSSGGQGVGDHDHASHANWTDPVLVDLGLAPGATDGSAKGGGGFSVSPEGLEVALQSQGLAVRVSTQRGPLGNLRWRVTFLQEPTEAGAGGGGNAGASAQGGLFYGSAPLAVLNATGSLQVAGAGVSGVQLAVAEESPGAVPMIQRVTVRAKLTLGGTFTLADAFGRTTRPLPWDATAFEVSRALCCFFGLLISRHAHISFPPTSNKCPLVPSVCPSPP